MSAAVPLSAVLPETAVAPLRCSAVLTHHWLVRYRGGEKVLAALAELLPDAPIYTLVHDPGGYPREGPAALFAAGGRRIVTSRLQLIPGARRHFAKLLPLMPWAARAVRLPDVDLVVCSDAALAKAMTPHPRSRVVCYCHSPMRYAFDPAISAEYERSIPALLRPLWPRVCRRVRAADVRATRHVHAFVANSRHVAERIRRWYGRESEVVYPPVDIPPEPPTAAERAREDFYLCVGHHVPYKRLDLPVDACVALRRRLVVIGDGPDVERLRRTRRADADIERCVTLLGWQPDEVVRDHLARAAALLFPGEEDFGIVPVEALAYGCPVIAYAAGGARETIVPGETGIWFDVQNVDAVCDAIRQRERTCFDPVALHRQAARFGRPRFLREMHAVLTRVLNGT